METPMGASAWIYFTPYQPDPEAALQKLRNEVFARGEYYKPWDAASSWHAELSQAPPEERAAMEDFLRSLPPSPLQPPEPLPATIQELLELYGASSTHSILDIERISDRLDFAAAAPLGEEELLASYGTRQPTREQFESCSLVWSDPPQRGQAVYFVVYKNGQPDEIAFLGNSGD
jgi:hypothetical protein